jgi:hypothetical protein
MFGLLFESEGHLVACFCWFLPWLTHVPPKRRALCELHGVTTPKTVLFNSSTLQILGMKRSPLMLNVIIVLFLSGATDQSRLIKSSQAIRRVSWLKITDVSGTISVPLIRISCQILILLMRTEMVLEASVILNRSARLIGQDDLINFSRRKNFRS